MEKQGILNITRKTAILVVLACATSLFSCQDEIFYEINKEVKLTDSYLGGDINSITMLDDFLYLQNGKVYFKRALSSNETGITDGGWSKYPYQPRGTISNIVSDGSYLYVMATEWTDDDHYGADGYEIEASRTIYCSKGFDDDGLPTGWSVVATGTSTLPNVGDSADTYAVSRIFCNNARKADGTQDKGNAHAFARLYDASSGWGIYKLNGEDKPELQSAVSPNVCAAAYSSQDVFTTQPCIVADSEGNLYTPTAETDTTGVDSSALSLGVAGNYIIAGTTQGIKRYDKSTMAEVAFTNNASSTLSSYYEVPVVYVLDPSAPDDTKTDIYASLNYEGNSSNALQNHRCLWAYYPRRGSWNRD